MLTDLLTRPLLTPLPVCFAEHHRATALTIVAQTSEAVASTLIRTGACEAAAAALIAELIQARMFLAMAASGPEVAVEEIVHQITDSVTFLVDRASPSR